MSVDSPQTPATTVRSVRAATEYLAAWQLAEGLWVVESDSGAQYHVEPDLPACECADFEYRSASSASDGDDVAAHGCKHIRRVRMLRGEIDLSPLLKAGVRINPILANRLDRRTGTNSTEVDHA